MVAKNTARSFHPTQPPPKICSDFRHNYNLLSFLQKARPLLQQNHDTYLPDSIQLSQYSSMTCLSIFLSILIHLLTNFIPATTQASNGATFIKILLLPLSDLCGLSVLLFSQIPNSARKRVPQPRGAFRIPKSPPLSVPRLRPVLLPGLGDLGVSNPLSNPQ